MVSYVMYQYYGKVYVYRYIYIDFAAFSYIRNSYVGSIIDVARTVLTNLSLLDLPIKDS